MAELRKSHRLFWLLAVFIAGALALAAACGGEEEKPSATPTPGGTPTAGALGVEIADNFFRYQGTKQPNLVGKAGSEVTVELENRGKAIHNLRIAGPDNRYETADDFVSNPDAIRPGTKATLKFKLDKPGIYNFRCDFHPQEQIGTIRVEQ